MTRMIITKPIMARMPMNIRPGVPITHSSARKMTSSRNVVPRSSPSMTSMHSSAAPGSSGSRSWRQSLSWPSFSLRASRSAPHSTKASLANSDGCTWNGPTWSHRVAPLASTPMARTSSRPRIEMPISG